MEILKSAKRRKASEVIDEIVGLVDEVMQVSTLDRVSVENIDGVLYPEVLFTGRYELKFIVPYGVEIRSEGAKAEIRIEPKKMVWLYFEYQGLSEPKFLRYNKKLVERLLDLAVKHRLGYPVNMMDVGTRGNVLTFYTPDGDVALEVGGKSYKLNYKVFAGSTRKAKTVLKWLEDLIIGAVSKELDKYDVDGSKFVAEGENFKISYDIEKKIVLDFEFRFGGLRVENFLDYVSMDDEEERIKAMVVVGMKRMVMFGALVGEKIHRMVKWLIF